MMYGRMVSETTALCLMGAVLFPWSIFLIGQKYTQEGFEKNATFRWVCAYLVLYILSAFMTVSAGLDWPITIQSALVCSGFMLFMPKHHTAEKIRNEIFWLGAISVCLYLPFELLGLVSFFTLKTIHVPLISSTIKMLDGRVYLCGNTNTAAIISSMNVLFSVYAIHASKKKWAKAFFIFAIIINCITLSHTQSRTSGIAFSVAISAFAFRGVALRIKQNKLRWIAGAAAVAIAFFLVLNGLNFVYRIDSSMARRLTDQPAAKTTSVSAESTESSAENTAAPKENAPAPELTSRIDQEGQFNLNSSGRGDIWISTLKYLKDHPTSLIFGVGQVNAISVVGEEYPHIAQYRNIHNSYLAAVFYCGVPFLICVLGFLCTLVPPAVRILLHSESAEERGNFMIPVMIGMILIIGVGEEQLFAKVSYSNFLLYIFAGYTLKLGARNKSLR